MYRLAAMFDALYNLLDFLFMSHNHFVYTLNSLLVYAGPIFSTILQGRLASKTRTKQ